MGIQLHTYLQPGDDPGDELIDKAFVKLTSLGDRWRGGHYVAHPRGDIYKSRAKFRNGCEPYERDVNLQQRFAPKSADGFAPEQGPIVLSTDNSQPQFPQQIENALLAMLLQDPAQAGSITLND